MMTDFTKTINDLNSIKPGEEIVIKFKEDGINAIHSFLTMVTLGMISIEAKVKNLLKEIVSEENGSWRSPENQFVKLTISQGWQTDSPKYFFDSIGRSLEEIK